MTTSDGIRLVVGFDVDDEVLSDLHARAFGNPPGAVVPWRSRLDRWSVARVGAFDGNRLVGFVHAAWDGGLHAFLLDTLVEPSAQGRGIGAALVGALRTEVERAGCEWLHVDFEPHLRTFYEDRCGFRATAAGLVRLR